MIIYKDILKKLSDSGYNTGRLRKEKLISENSLQRIRDNRPLSTDTLDRICELTGCQPGELLEYVKAK